MNWTKFQDPREQAFDIDVPAGWSVRGGLARMGYSDARAMVDVASPDGAVNVRLGDFWIPVYALPTQLHPREGEILDLGAQAQLTVSRYRSGQEFSSAYAKGRFGSLCPNGSIQPKDARADAPVKDYAPAGDAPPVHTTTGQTAFQCSSAQGPREAYVYARTSMFQGFWAVPTLVSIAAPPDQMETARAIVRHMAESLRMNPHWIEYQKQQDRIAIAYQQERQQQRRRVLSMQVAQFEMKMQAMRNQVSHFERQQARQAAQVDEVSNILTGITPTVDPYGNRRDVWTGGANRYWRNGMGHVVNSNVPPGGGGWTELTPLQ